MTTRVATGRVATDRGYNNWLPILALGAAATILVAIAVSRLLYPYDVGQYEGGTWAPAQLLAEGVNPYRRELTTTPPYVMAPYGVLYYALVGAGLKLFGLQFWFARALSALSVAVCAWCIFKLTWHFTRDKTAALLGPLLFCAQFPVQAVLGVQRPDCLALAFSLGGLTVALLHTNSQHSPLRSALWPALLLVAAILTRQTSILPVAIVVGWYALNGMRARLLSFVGLVILFFLGVLFWMNATSQGGYLWQQFVMPTSVGKSLSLVVHHLSALLKAPVTLAIVIFGCVGWLQARQHGSIATENALKNYRVLIGVYCVLALLLALVTSSRLGSSINYWLEVSAVVALLVPLFWTDALTTAAWRPRRTALLALVTLALAFTGLRVCRGELLRWKSLPYFREIVAQIESRTGPQQPIYSVYPELAAFAGRPYYFNDYIQYDGRARRQQQIFDAVLQTKKVAALIVREDAPRAGYKRVELAQPVPEGSLRVFLFVRE